MTKRKAKPAPIVPAAVPALAPVVWAGPAANHMSIFRNADGSMNVGYVTLFWIVFSIIIVVLSMLGAAFWEQSYDPQHKFNYLPFGQGVGLVVTALLPMLAGVAAFLWADSKNPQAGTTTTTSLAQQQTSVTPPVAGT